MKNWKSKIEQKLEILSDLIFENSKKTIFLVLLFVVALGSQLPKIAMDTSTEGFLHETDPLRLQYDEFKNQFGRDEKLLIAIQTDNIFDLKFLKKLDKFHQELENNLPHITEVNSLINARNTYGTADSLVVDDLFEAIPQDEKALQLKKQLAVNNPFFKDLLLDDKGTITTIIVDTQTYTSLDEHGKPLIKDDDVDDDGFSDENNAIKPINDKEFITDFESTQIVKKAQQIATGYQDKNFDILISGNVAISSEIKSSMAEDMQKFIKYVLLVITVFLAILFRRISGVILPLITVALTIITAASLMAIFKAPITVITQILPSFLLAVSIGASVHILSIFFKDFNKNKDKKSSLRYAMGHSGFAIIMTSITTAAGLWSFSFSEVAPIDDLGVFASSGVLIGLIFTLILLPALLSVIPLKPKDGVKNKTENSQNMMDKILIKIAHTSTHHPKTIIVISAIIIFASIITASQLRFSHNVVEWLPSDNSARMATEAIDKKMRGSVTLEIVIDTQKTNGLYEPIVLNKIDNLSKDLLKIKTDKYFVGKTLSIVDIIKETNKALNENKSEFWTIPTDKNLIAQELLLFENSGSDDLEDFVDSQFSKARITIKLPTIDAVEYVDFLKDVDVIINKYFDDSYKITVTGITSLLSRVITASIHSSAISYIIALSLITIMMLILVGHIKIGLISMIPNIAPILMMTTIMVIFDMPLDMFTMLIGAIAIGLAVDDTVHFMHNFRKYEMLYNDINKAVEMTLLTTGRAMVVTTIVLSMGFLVFMFASMGNIFNFGLLTAIAIVIALLADFFLIPAIMKVIVKNRSDIE